MKPNGWSEIEAIGARCMAMLATLNAKAALQARAAGFRREHEAQEDARAVDRPLTQGERMVAIYEAVRPGRPVEIDELSRRLRVTRRTVFRDVMAINRAPLRLRVMRGKGWLQAVAREVPRWESVDPRQLALPTAPRLPQIVEDADAIAAGEHP